MELSYGKISAVRGSKVLSALLGLKVSAAVAVKIARLIGKIEAEAAPMSTAVALFTKKHKDALAELQKEQEVATPGDVRLDLAPEKYAGLPEEYLEMMNTTVEVDVEAVTIPADCEGVTGAMILQLEGLVEVAE